MKTTHKKIGTMEWNGWLAQIASAVLSVLIALMLGAVVIAFLGADPLRAYEAIVIGAFGNVNAISETLVKTVPLLLVGLGLSVVFKGNFWNIGAEGQIFMGGLAATWFVLMVGNAVPPILVIPAGLMVGFAAGAAWGAIAAILKVKMGIDEIIVTIMLNYIAILFNSWVIHNPLRDPKAGFPRTSLIPESAQLPILIPGTRLDIAIIFAVVSVLIIYYILWRTPLGYHIRAVGDNKEAAVYGGINSGRVTIIAMLISGGLAGIAGMSLTLGIFDRMIEDISGGIGFKAIAVALLANNQPLAVPLTAFLLASLDVGANAMQYRANVPVAMVDVIQGLVILFVVAREFFMRRWLAPRYTILEPSAGVYGGETDAIKNNTYNGS